MRDVQARKGCSPLQVLLISCISFMLGYMFSWLKVAETSMSHQTISQLMDYPSASSFQTTSSPKASKDAANPMVDDLHAYITTLINTTVGTELMGQTKFSGEELKQVFRGALIQALTIEKFACEKTARVTRRVDNPRSQDDNHKPAVEQKKPRLPSVKYFSGLGKVNRMEFDAIIGTGVPLHLSARGEDPGVVILYGSEKSLPKNSSFSDAALYAGNDAIIPVADALENCQQLGVVHVKIDRKEPIACWAFVPGQESFHIQKWLRVPTLPKKKIDPAMPLRLVSRGYDGSSGREYPGAPNEKVAKEHREWLGEYFSSTDSIIEELRPIVERIAKNKQLIITVVNSGQSELLMNFACAAKSRGLDISNVLAFVLDEESKELVEGLGMTSYFNSKFLGELPSSEPRVFGDRIFAEIVVAKFMCTHLLSIMGYDFLFQDVDIVWYKDPMTFFNDPKLADPEIDIFFQDDINGQIRYQPLRGNSGFYYVRNNDRTRSAFKDAVTRTDELFVSFSHQQTLLEVLSEHISYHGLRVKTFDADDTTWFPNGGHFLIRPTFMKDFIAGKLKDVYLFHMNWTGNKKVKLAYLKQMGEWFVRDTCTNRPLKKTLEEHSNLTQALSGNFSIGHVCCSREPLFSCHYRDKPSIRECKSSPSLDGKNGTKSWW